jgi:glycosyltransferase involved in cell wall biosynthesis
VRLAVYSDYAYRRDGDVLWAEVPVVLFLAGLAAHVDSVTLVGRLDEQTGPWNTRVPEGVDFEPLPFYPSLGNIPRVLAKLPESVRRFWRVLNRVDAVWLFGPHPVVVVFALVAMARRKTVALGVRQDFPAYVRNRHPDSRAFHLVADALEGAWRLLARRCRVVVVGPELARNYRRSPRVLPIGISLISERAIAPPEALAARDYDGGAPLTALSVGRLEAEKNPLMLAGVLARLGPRWRLVVCGDGPLEAELAERLAELGVADRAELRGYVDVEAGLMDLYRSSHALLHVSWTEGVPQVLFEAFSARLPMVATAVGGVGETVGDAGLLVPPGDPDAAARALERLAAEPELRERLVEAGARRAAENSLEAGTARVARFLGAGVHDA